MFDCVLPTRCARNGLLFTHQGRLNLRNAVHARDEGPPDPRCDCYTCRTHSRAYLRHLFAADELLALRLATLHNLHHYLSLMRGARAAIAEDRFAAFAADVRAREGGRAPSLDSRSPADPRTGAHPASPDGDGAFGELAPTAGNEGVPVAVEHPFSRPFLIRG